MLTLFLPACLPPCQAHCAQKGPKVSQARFLKPCSPQLNVDTHRDEWGPLLHPWSLPAEVNGIQGAFLVVQWLGLGASTTGGMGMISGQGTKLPHATMQPEINT